MKESHQPNDAVAARDAQYDQAFDEVNNHIHVSCKFFMLCLFAQLQANHQDEQCMQLLREVCIFGSDCV